MGFFDDLKSTLGDAATLTADKAKDLASMTRDKVRDLAEITKLKSELSHHARDLESTYLEIGKLLFPSEKDKADSPAAQQCKTVGELQTKIAELNAKIQEVKSRGRVTDEEVDSVVPEEPASQDTYLVLPPAGKPKEQKDE